MLSSRKGPPPCLCRSNFGYKTLYIIKYFLHAHLCLPQQGVQFPIKHIRITCCRWMILYWMETTHMQDHVVFVVVTVVLYPLFFEGLDVVIWLHTIHLSFYYITNLMIHFTKNTFYRKMIHTCWKYEFP